MKLKVDLNGLSRNQLKKKYSGRNNRWRERDRLANKPIYQADDSLNLPREYIGLADAITSVDRNNFNGDLSVEFWATDVDQVKKK